MVQYSVWDREVNILFNTHYYYIQNKNVRGIYYAFDDLKLVSRLIIKIRIERIYSPSWDGWK